MSFRFECFNPRPASRSGDALDFRDAVGPALVSIRARPHGRAMPGIADDADAEREFQSAPGLTVGRCQKRAGGELREQGFQSAPGLTVGRCIGGRYRSSKCLRFQSAPGLTVGRC